MPTFLSAYQTWCTKNKLTPDIVDIPGTNGTKGFWIGSKTNAKYTLVYYHGGGFVLPGGDAHINMLFNFVKWSNNNLAVFCVAYTLSPQALYPVALGEAVEGLRYILDQPGHSASTTLLGGDSAGGNLVLAVLSHVSNHPHSNADKVKPFKLSEDLMGAIAIAPWTSSDISRFPSMTKYAARDIVNHTCANYWISAYKGSKDVSDNEYICAVLAEADWWKGTKCKEMLVTAGEQEVLVDGITYWVGKYTETMGAEHIKYVIGKREIHDAPLFSLPEAQLEKLGEASQEGAIRLWIKQKLAT